MINRLTLNDVLPSPLSGNNGIISYLQSYNPPWAESDIYTQLDIYYYGNHSGNKIISPLLEQYLINDVISDADLPAIAHMLSIMFGKKWARLWNVYNETYNPTENYNMVENGNNESTTEYGKTETKTDNLTNGVNTTIIDTPNITDERTPNTTRELHESVYGFNSNNASPSSNTSETNTGLETTRRTGTNTQTTTTTETNIGTVTNESGGNDTNSNTHTLTRHGNIGVTTTQQMLQSEIDLWQWNFFNDVLFRDLDSLLTIQIY